MMPVLNDLAGIDEVLAEIDARARELERRTAAVLAQTSHHETNQKESRIQRRMP